MKQKKIESFTDLNAWREAHKLAIKIYKETDKFPAKEQFGITNQIRRAAVSITSNIAEGFSRITKADKIHFNVMAKGSVTEVQSQLLIAHDVGYLKAENFKGLSEQSMIVHKLLNGLIKALNSGKGIKP